MSTASSVPDLIPAGAVIGRRYRIDGMLAEGGMGIVYKGFHLALQQPIAIKVVRAEFADRPEAVARFLNEARALAGLRGPHIAQVLDVGRMGNGPPYMVLEYLEGQDLRTVLEVDGPLNVEQAVTYTLEACEALAEAHARGIIHRDIKPENLFLTGPRDGMETVKLIDFGVSKRLDPSSRSYTEEGQSLGSPHYMAPEQMTKPHEVDARADIWSLGVVLFEILSGAVPFAGETLPAACASILSAEPRSLTALRPNVPCGLERVVRRCLAKAPADRYADVAELAEALLPFSGPEGLDSLRRIRRSLGRHKSSSNLAIASAPQAAAIELDKTPPPRILSQARSEPEIPKRSRWIALAIAATGGLAAWLALTHSDGLARIAEPTRAALTTAASDTAERIGPATQRAVNAASSTTRELLTRILPTRAPADATPSSADEHGHSGRAATEVEPASIRPKPRVEGSNASASSPQAAVSAPIIVIVPNTASGGTSQGAVTAPNIR